jgi:SAM-dependent methyltransferase
MAHAVSDPALHVTTSASGAGPLPAGLCCPGCRGTLSWEERTGRCPSCGQVASVWGGDVTDFLGVAGARVEAILEWTDEALARAERGLIGLATGDPPAGIDRAELVALGLVDADTRLTGLGFKVAYHLAENRRQAAGDAIADAVLDALGVGAEARLLDVGGGAGQTLRLLTPRHPAERVVLDAEPEGLALGRRLVEGAGEDVRFVRASGHELPFADDRFTHVVCRGALNCMHQRTALGEMARVLRPGGALYLRIEGFGQDVAQVASAVRARRARLVARHLRDLALGVVLGLTSRQAAPGGRFVGYRNFATVRGVRRTLGRVGCEVRSVTTLVSYFGMPQAVEIVARKLHPRPRQGVTL